MTTSPPLTAQISAGGRAGWRGEVAREKRERRHARVHVVAGVVEAQAHAHDQMLTFVATEDEARGELGGGADVLDRRRGRRDPVDEHLRARADVERCERRGRDEDIDVGMVVVAQQHDRRTRADDLARIGDHREHGAGDGRREHEQLCAPVLGVEARGGGGDPRPRGVELGRARAGLHARELVLQGLALGLAGAELAADLVEGRRRRRVIGDQLFFAREARRERALRGLERAHLGL